MSPTTPPDEQLARRLPLPLAQLYRRAHNARESIERHQAAYFLWEAALKLLGAVAIATYADCGLQDPRAAERMTNLARPALGHWWEFVRVLVPLLAEAGEDNFRAARELIFEQELADLDQALALDAALRQELEGASPPRKKVRLSELFERLVRYRNREIGHGAIGQRPREFYEHMGPKILAGVAQVLGRLVDALEGWRLVYVADVRKHRSQWVIERDELTGETPRRLEPLSLPATTQAALPNSECLYLEAAADGEAASPRAAVLRSLQPLVTYDPATGEVYFLNSQQGQQRTQYLCYLNARVVDREELPEEQGELLSRLLRAPVDRAKAGQWAARAQEEEEQGLTAARPPAAAETPTAPAPAETSEPALPAEGQPGRPPAQVLRVALLYRRNVQPDEQLLAWLEKAFTAHGHQVFIDRHMTIGVEWARELETQIRASDAAVVLLSPASAQSEMMACEIRMAHEEAQKCNGRPRLLPVRIGGEAPLPAELASILDRLQYFLWQGPQDNQRLFTELLTTLSKPPAISTLAPPGGVVPLDSKLYVVRPSDEEFQAALMRRDSIVLIRGARQMGKTSLLARGLQQARVADARVVMTDFQKLNAQDLESADKFLRTLADWLADDLELDVLPDDVWSERRGPSVNFERYVRREVLGKLTTPLVWALDEVDRLFPCPFASEVFGLFRSWHNARGLDPASPWSRLTLAIAYATEANLFITDMNQSPFNVGTLLALEDFTPPQLAELNRRYGSPLRTRDDLLRFARLVGGHPYLSNRGLYELVHHGLDIAAFEMLAGRDEGVFGDHLRRILVLLASNPELGEVVRGLLRGEPCRSPEAFYQLRSAGVLAGDSTREARLRCHLYTRYLERHLL